MVLLILVQISVIILGMFPGGGIPPGDFTAECWRAATSGQLTKNIYQLDKYFDRSVNTNSSLLCILMQTSRS